jgi:hypothetical protein
LHYPQSFAAVSYPLGHPLRRNYGPRSRRPTTQNKSYQK